MIDFEFIGGAALAATLRAWSPKLQQELQQSIGRSAIRLQRHVRENKLSGQVLNARTGTLRRSIDQVVEMRGNVVTGIVNTNLRYGAVHEFGFNGVVNVKAHLRLIKQAFGKPLKEPRYVQVKAYSMNVKLPERSFLRSALRDLQPSIQADLAQSIERVIQ